MGEISCISPVDGSTYATRPTEPADSVRRRLARARAAQKAWAERPLAERIALDGYGGWGCAHRLGWVN